MWKRNRIAPFITPTLTLIVAACFVTMCLLSGGCADEEDAVPQEHSETDLMPDPESASKRTLASEDPNPWGEAAISSIVPVSGAFDRSKASWYIQRYAKNPNPEVAYCALRDGTTADCTNFASQVLWYAGLPMRYTANAEEGWWYTKSCSDRGSSKSWRQVNRLLQYLIVESGQGEFRKSARDLKVGDLIFYRLRREEEGYACGTGNLFNHSSVVSGFDEKGEPLVSYHSNDAIDVPWNVKNASKKSLGEACLTGFVHIRD